MKLKSTHSFSNRYLFLFFLLFNYISWGQTSEIIISSNEIPELNYAFGNGPSIPESFTILGNNFSNDITINAPENFEIRNNNIPFYGNSIRFTLYNGESKIIYIRLKAGLNIGTYTGNLTIESDVTETIIFSIVGNVLAAIIDAPVVNEQIFCGSKTIADLPQNNGNFKWYNSLTSENALALNTNLTSGTYYVANSINGSESDRVTVAVTINQTPNIPVVNAQTFCGSKTIADLPQNNGNFKWYNSLTSENALTLNTNLISGTYYVSNAINGCESDRVPVAITINLTPNIPVVNAQTFCGSKTIADLPQNNGNFKWYNSLTSENALSLNTNLNSGMYYVSNVINGCESDRIPVAITINQTPNIPIVNEQTFCDSKTIADLPQNNGNFKWYNSLTSENALTLNTNLNSGTYYVSNVINGCESDRVAVEITVNQTPNITVVNAQTFCGSKTIADLPQNNGNFKWYNSLTSENALSLNTNLNSGTYYVSNVINGCESDKIPVAITINQAPNIPVVNTQTFCGSKTIADLPQNNGNFKWYNSLTNENGLSLNTNLTSGTYYVSNVINGCESDRVAVEITINQAPNIPVVNAQTFCGSKTIADLPQNNGNFKWYNSLTNENGLSLNTNLTSGTYYVSNVINGCESDRVAVEITINQAPNIPVVNAQTFCGSKTIADLPQNNGNFKWYNSLTSENPLLLNTNLTSGMYYVSNVINGCESDRIPVAITINQTPNIPVVNAQFFCGTKTIADLPQNNENFKWYNSLTSENALALNTNLNSGTYYVSNVINDCESDRISVAITINQTPNIPVVNAQTFCGSKTIADLPQNNGNFKWYNSLTSENALLLNTNLNSGTYYVSNVINGCESDRVPVAITINQTPNIPVVNAQTFCGTKTITDLPQNNENFKWYNSLTNENALALNTNLISGTYYVANVINGCESDRVAVEITINQAPNIPVVNAQTFCGSKTIADLPQNNGNFKWYNSLTNENALSLNTNLNSGTYYVSNVINGCESDRISVAITINQTPNIPVVNAQTFCGSKTIADLPQNNGNFKWYNSLTSENALSLNTNLNSGTYYVSNVINSCESDRVAVAVTLTNLPLVATLNLYVFCGMANVSDLVATGIEGAEILWFSSLNQTNALTPNTLLSTGTYYVSQKKLDCYSERKAVSVKIISTNAPSIPSFTFCGSARVSDLTLNSQTGITYKWYNSITSTSSLPINATLSTGTYYATRVENGCESLKSAVQVVIKDIPESPTGQSYQTFIQGSKINNLNVQPSSAVWFMTLEDARAGTNPLSQNTALMQGTTYYAVNIGTNGCLSNPFAVRVDITLNNESFIKKDIKYYPNPVIDILTVEHIENINQLEIYNTLGQHLYSNKYNDSKIEIDFSSLTSGTYILKVFTNQGETFLKVIKQ